MLLGFRFLLPLIIILSNCAKTCLAVDSIEHRVLRIRKLSLLDELLQAECVFPLFRVLLNKFLKLGKHVSLRV